MRIVSIVLVLVLVSVIVGVGLLLGTATHSDTGQTGLYEPGDSQAQLTGSGDSAQTASAASTASLIRDLGNPEWTTKMAAARTLAIRQDRAIFNVLVRDLDSKEANRCLGSALALALRKEPQALRALFEQCPRRGISFRFQVAEALGQAKNVAFKDTLIAALNDQNWQVREFAVVSLANMHEAIGIEPLLLSLKNDDPYIRRIGCWQLGCIGDTQAIEPLIVDILRKYDSYDYKIWGATGISMITEGKVYFGADLEKWEQWWKQNKHRYAKVSGPVLAP